ncbi:hypothetical protein ANCCEY_07059 [Ancylostoma ceylanicum]|uniref:Uncharacterized protein n=1 Tax=Ancylostoma ceylanicum TaxID=53326 RepID=A0A0D6LP62_9BILA|nr:hypothetical protein ANCCEY_07059 [Ancylostoma ceylanicum]
MCMLAGQHTAPPPPPPTPLAPLWSHHTIRPALSDRCGPPDEQGIRRRARVDERLVFGMGFKPVFLIKTYCPLVGPFTERTNES